MTDKQVSWAMFWYADVQEIVLEELENGTDELKERVRLAVISKIGILDDNLPEKIRAWVYQLCLPHTAGTPQKIFTGKLARSIDLASLSNR